MFTLEILQKVREGTLRATEKRDIAAAAPLLVDYLVHDQPNIILALFDEQLYQARKHSPEHERDVYWEGISQIARSHRKSRDTAHWILQELTSPRFPPHTEEELEQRSSERQKHSQQMSSVQLVQRHGTSSHFDITFGIMEHALLKLDEPTVLQAAQLIADNYKGYLRKRINEEFLKHRGSLLGLNGGNFKLSGHFERPPITIQYLKDLSRLADKMDSVLGIRGTRKEFIKATFMQALGNEGDADVKAYILKKADRLPAEDRLNIALRYTKIYYRYDGCEKSLCGTLGGRHDRNVIYTEEIDVFDRFVDTLKKWTAGSKSIDFSRAVFGLNNQYLDHTDWQDLRTTGVFSPERIKHYDPALRWVEVQRRLEMIRTAAAMPEMKPFDFDTNAYLEAATIRAVTYGHAEDLKDIFDYYDSLTPEQKKARRFQNGYLYHFPQHESYGSISRDPALLRVMTERLPLSLWVPEEPSDKPPLLVRLMGLTDPNDRDIDRKHYFLSSYVSAGHAMTMRQVTASYEVLFPFLERALPHLSAAQREDLDHRFIDEGYRPVFFESIRGLIESHDPEAPQYWVKAIYHIHPEEVARNYVRRIAEHIAGRTISGHHAAVTTGFFKAIKECDPDPEAWQDILANLSYSRNKFFALYITHQLAPEMLQLGDDTPSSKLVSSFIAKIPGNPKNMDEILADARKELGLPDPHPRWESPHQNVRLMNEIMPYMNRYAEMEGSHNSVEQSGRLSCLFDTFRQVDTFLRRHAQPTRQPIHDLCLFDLPQKGSWDKQIWGKLAIRFGHPILRLLPHAPGIEAYMRDNIEPMNEERRRINRDKLGKTGAAIHDRTLSLDTMSPSMIRAIAVRVGYQRGAENRALANFCINLMAEEKAFNETLDLLSRFKRTGTRKDRMPNLDIDGVTVGLDGYRMERVPHGDPLSLWIGKIVNCCNHLGGDGADMARAQFKDPDNGLYIIRDKRDRPIAKLSGWLSDKGNVVFNAWERKSEQEDFLLTRFTAAAALQILERHPKIKRVMLGAGPLNPGSLPFQMAADPEEPKSGVGRTSDSKKQFILAERHTMGDTYEMLDWEIAADIQRGECRIKLRWNEMRQLGLD